jgi:hypothetical protein
VIEQALARYQKHRDELLSNEVVPAHNRRKTDK